jgi:tetratricopeptide (TPR) repeat protein
MVRSISFALTALLALALPPPVARADNDAKKQSADEEVDYLALAARLVKDGHYDRAELTLQKVDDADERVDKKLLYTLRGLISMNAKVYVDAAANFEKAIAAGSSDPVMWMSLGQARFGMKDYRGAVDALERAGQTARADARVELLRSRAHWELGEQGEALDVLARASMRFPDAIDFPRTEMFYLIELGLFRELTRRGAAFLDRPDVEAGDLAAMGEALRKGGQLAEARQFVEKARLRFPDDVPLTVLLSRIYLDGEQLLSSALLLEEVARHDPQYLVEAAEMYRRAGRLERALFLNARISDQKAKMKQRLQIQLELEQFEQISAMEARLSRLGLLGDPQIRYALAYGFFMIRDFVAAERHIKRIDDPALFEQGNELRKAIAACQAAGWLCQ